MGLTGRRQRKAAAAPAGVGDSVVGRALFPRMLKATLGVTSMVSIALLAFFVLYAVAIYHSALGALMVQVGLQFPIPMDPVLLWIFLAALMVAQVLQLLYYYFHVASNPMLSTSTKAIWWLLLAIQPMLIGLLYLLYDRRRRASTPELHETSV